MSIYKNLIADVGSVPACTACGMPRPDPATQFKDPIISRRLSQSDVTLSDQVHADIARHTVPGVDDNPGMIITSFFTTVTAL